jgi:hypothetical protein
MERTEVLDMMSGLKLYGMRSAYDETLTTALKRKHEPQRFVGDLACCRFRGHRDWVFHEGGGGRCNDENLPESSRSRQFG